MSKCRVYGLLVVAVVAFMCAGCEDGGGGSLGDGHDFGDNDQNKYVAVGDSITRGYNATIPYPAVLSSMLGKPVVNKGVNGARAAEGFSAINATLASNKPGFLLILYGANDVIHSNPPSEVIESLRGIIRAAKANKTIPVIATTPPQVGSHSAFNGGVISLNVRIRSLAGEEGVKLVDLEAALDGHNEYFTSDGLHPNNTGHSVIAAEFFDVLD
jgi:lysophospholipase L1-like esterase